MKTDFWSSTEYSGFMGDLVEGMNNAGCPTRQRFLISEASYRSATSKPARLWLRLRQYVLYPLYLTGSLLFGRKADVVGVEVLTEARRHGARGRGCEPSFVPQAGLRRGRR